jgi:hypothetical protein
VKRPSNFMVGRDISTDTNGFWTPPTQPKLDWGMNGVPTSKDPEGVINALYEPLRALEPEYMTRVLVGQSTPTDQPATLDTGIYNIYRYVLEPPSYSKTMIFSAGTHGNEYTAFFALWRFIYHLIHDWRKYPQLRYIRQNVRIILLPMNNPWGFKNNKRQNARLVDPNRNTDYLWNYITTSRYQPGGTNYKGTAPFSENEVQYYKQAVDTYNDALAAIDLHTIVSVAAEHIVYTPRYISQHREIYDDTIDWLNRAGHRMVNGSAAVPTLYCYAANTYGMTASNPEWYNGLWSSEVRGSLEMTEAVKYFGNIFIKACKLTGRAQAMNDSSKFYKVLMYDKATTPTPITVTNTAFTNFDHMLYQYTPRRYGAFKVKVKLRFTISAPATVSFNPVLYQSYHPEMSWTATKDADTFTVTETYAAAGTYNIDMWAIMHAFPTNYNETGAGETQRTAEAKFRLRGKSTAGTITIERMRAQLEFEPNDRGRLVEHINYTGLEANAEGSDYVVAYPDPVKYVDDSQDDD